MEISPSSTLILVLGDRRVEFGILIRCIDVSPFLSGVGDGVNTVFGRGFEVDNHAPGGLGVWPGTDRFALGGVAIGGVRAIPTCIS